MKLSPKAVAYAAQAVVSVPYLILTMFFRDQVTAQTLASATFLYFLVAILVYRWVYHRQVSPLPASQAVLPELDLVSDALPKIVWLAAIPPVLAASMLAWVAVHGANLPWRDTWMAPPSPAVSHPWYRTMVLFVVVWNCVSLFGFVCALAAWHGMSRAYKFRRTILVTAVMNQWTLLIGTMTWAWGIGFRLPVAAAAACAIVNSLSLCAAIWNGWRARDVYAASPRIGTWFYSDARDPTFLGPRGINLASSWCWIVAVSGIAPLVLVQWILSRVQG